MLPLGNTLSCAGPGVPECSAGPYTQDTPSQPHGHPTHVIKGQWMSQNPFHTLYTERVCREPSEIQKGTSAPKLLNAKYTH